MMANECDIVESFVRHTLAFADHLHIQFHNSYDASQQIVERLVAEGLPISFERSDDPVFSRELLGDRLARTVASEDRFDFILPLDTDEFIVADDRPVLEDELARVATAGALSVNWLAYVPIETDDPNDPNPVTRIRHRAREPSSVHKVFFAARMLAHEDVYVSDGNHNLLSRCGRSLPHSPSQRVFLAHFPVRSAQQFASKVAIGRAARLLSPDFNENQSPHWRALAPLLDVEMPIRELSQHASEFLDSGAKELIDAPLVTAARTLKYSDLVKVDAFQRLSAFVSAVLSRRLAAAQSAGGADLVERRRLMAELETARHVMQRLNDRIRSGEQDRSELVERARQAARRYQRLVWALAVAAGAAVALLAILYFR